MAEIVRTQFGDIWASAGEKLSPEVTKIQAGWVQEMMPYQWQNFLQSRSDTFISYLLQKGIPEWSNTQEYIANKSFVQANGNIYMAIQTQTGALISDTSAFKRISPNTDSAGTVLLTSGGTGATTAAGARTNLGLGSSAVLNATTIGTSLITAASQLEARTAIGAGTSSLELGTGASQAAPGNHIHPNVTTSVSGFMSFTDKSKLDGIEAGANNYVHPSGDGFLHVPATGSNSAGKVLKAGGTPGSIAWGTLTKTDIGLGNVDDTSDATKNVLSATKLTTARTISVSGAVTATATAFDGTSNISIPVTALNASFLSTGTVPTGALQNAVIKNSATTYASMPFGPTSGRGAGFTAGATRINSDTRLIEYYDGVNWLSVNAELNSKLGEPLGTVAWWNGPRTSIPAGRVPMDGQRLDLADYPDVVQYILAGNQHTVTESVWQADPAKRNCWSTGDGSTWVRVPDMNGAVAGSGKPFYLRGSPDSLNGTSVGDAIRNITGAINATMLRGGASSTGAFSDTELGTNNRALATGSGVADNSNIIFNASSVVPTADENRVKTAYGVWTVKIFGAITNTGALDAGQLATQLGVVDAKVQTLDANTGFTIIYPNGGTQASPASVAINSRYVESNPFAGFPVMCSVELLYGGEWGEVKLSGNTSSSYGADVGQHNEGSIVLLTGTQYLITATALHYFSGVRPGTAVSSALPCRIKVWKLKGGV